jgi:nicotinate phosphoribosyltransferase
MANGEILIEEQTPSQINAYLQKRFAQLPDEHKRFISPHIYKVGVSKNLIDLRKELMGRIRNHVK